MKKVSVFGNRRAQNAAKELGIEIHEQRELEHAYGSHSFYRTVDKYIMVDSALSRKFNRILAGKNTKSAPALTPEQKIERWAKRLDKLTGCGIADAQEIAKEKIEYEVENAQRIMDTATSAKYHNAAVDRYNRVIDDSSKALHSITDTEHAFAIIAASNRHRNTNYEDKLDEGRELAALGEIERENIREYARQNYENR